MTAAEKKAAAAAAKATAEPAVPQTEAAAAQSASQEPQSVESKNARSVSREPETAEPFQREPTAEEREDEGYSASADAAIDALYGGAPEQVRQQFAPNTAIVESRTHVTERAARIAELQEETLLLELETKRILLEMTTDQNLQYKQTKAERIAAAAAAQSLLDQAAWTQKQIEAGCAHATGGFGLDEIYEGDNKPSLVAMELPIPGRKVILCYRCIKAVTTPDPNLRFTNAERWFEQTADYKEFLRLLRKSLSKPMGAPNFNFEKDGMPVHPEMR